MVTGQYFSLYLNFANKFVLFYLIPLIRYYASRDNLADSSNGKIRAKPDHGRSGLSSIGHYLIRREERKFASCYIIVKSVTVPESINVSTVCKRLKCIGCI